MRLAFPDEARARVYQIVDSLKAAFKNRISLELPWINDAATREAIMRKIDGVKPLLGYPDFVLDTQELDRIYADLYIKEDDFMANIVIITNF
jgi:predicted metalloendopeptidase